MAIKYKIKKDSNNPAEVLFERTGATQEVTLGDLDYNIKVNTRRKQEIEAQLKIEEAKLKNVLQSNPEVEKIDKKTRIACYIYERSKSMLDVGKEKIKEFEAEIKSNQKEMADITAQTGKFLMTLGDAINKNDKEKK